MSQEETKTQAQSTQDKASGSSKPTTTTTSKATEESEQEQQQQNKEELIIEQVRNELETYFAPQNIQNDLYLRQKMTADGYIDIDYLLDLKLISDLASNRDILIEAISRSKLLVMNTGCTMVKYMPLLERNILILRDIPTTTAKADIVAIFDNDECGQPVDVHADIGNNWFCEFKTEEDCLKTAKYLQQFGKFHGEQLHVRVKAIHDKNKADTSPQMQVPPMPKKSKQIPPPQPYAAVPPQYAPGYYQNPQYAAYYGPPLDPYAAAYPAGYGAPPMQAAPPVQAARAPKSGSRTSKSKRSRTDEAEDTTSPPSKTNGQQTPQSPLEAPPMAAYPPAAAQPATAAPAVVVEEDRTATSDYPGVFDKYSQEEFVNIYREMTENPRTLVIPQSMRGRDARIVSETVITPVAMLPAEPEPEAVAAEDGKEAVDEEAAAVDTADIAKKSKRKKKRKKEVVQGAYYEEDVYNQAGDVPPADAYYDDEYDDGAYFQGAYYEEDAAYNAYYYDNARGARAGAGGGGGGRSGRSGRASRGSRRGNQGKDYYYYGGGGAGGRRGGSGSGSGGGGGGYREQARQYRSKRNPSAAPSGASKPKATYQPKSKQSNWAPKTREAKQYNTNKGVYRKAAASY
eukprot:CAMPEP_0197021164 /NCGR_PEP_ID=MMETSP1384-20130603/2054_1 /TAXON_ID=29189 /ORGANISM="Ammonia sp." /LENGTH=626 /DNA_ID=CAMNT_0042448929 /DNA_START=120 /DNA_END=2000 /DNA_ORIENTATION=+